VSHLLGSYDVTWVNTIGMRRPRLDLATIRRGMEKLRHWDMRKSNESAASRPVPIQPAPRIVNPLMWPSFASRLSRRANRTLLVRQLKKRIPGLESSVVLTTIPIVADLVGHLPASRWVYYCVDDFSEWPGLDSKTLRDMEALLIQSVDEIVAAGDNLARRIEQQGRDSVVISHGVDLKHWEHGGDAAANDSSVSQYEHPIVLFWGLIDRRLDIAWLKALGRSMTSGTIVLVGPQQDTDPDLQQIERVRLTGPMPFERLPSIAKAADVLIMPYADLPVTRAMQPLKLKEYLATGKPVVVRRLPATDDWDDCMFTAEDAGHFTATVIECLHSGLPAQQRTARERLVEESWSAKAEALERVLLPQLNLEVST
jgi:glycosyltransferase involved in cell wall biosynthesis